MIKINKHEKNVFCAYEMDALRSHKEVARLAHCKEYQAGYTKRRLMELSLLGQIRPAFNVYALGLSDYAFFFSLAAPGDRKRQRFLQALEQSAAVSWCAEIGGAYQYAASFVSKHVHHVHAVLNKLASGFEGNVSGQVAMRVRVESYGRKYLSPVAHKSTVLWFGGAPGKFQLSGEDYSLIDFLARGDWESWRDVARKTGLSASMVQRKLHTYEVNGFITGYYYTVDPFKLGVQVFNLLVRCRTIPAQISEKLRQFAKSHPNIVHFIECFGSWDFEIVVECEEARQAVEVATLLQDSFPQAVDSIEVIPVFKYLKSNLVSALNQDGNPL